MLWKIRFIQRGYNLDKNMIKNSHVHYGFILSFIFKYTYLFNKIASIYNYDSLLYLEKKNMQN